jgi:hypothetical protein
VGGVYVEVGYRMTKLTPHNMDTHPGEKIKSQGAGSIFLGLAMSTSSHCRVQRGVGSIHLGVIKLADGISENS